ncbi:type I-F CRISPR-associated protein Csy1 [Pseudomonas sp. F1_0610]|uniref:type I-F CRISPR-associated protein Csy1 n=1 Tax=Pseudomonas sp. F1_0610 TaxID=3114284 RepID=UPI0039C33322
MIETINDFVSRRKATWLEAKLKKAKDDTERQQFEIDATERFNLANWLSDAAKRASQLSITTHPSKFSHPSAKSTSVIANNPSRCDGYLRSGNVVSQLDAFGNAAAMDVYQFLSLPIPSIDNQNILDAFEQSNISLQETINNLGLNFEELKDSFLTIKQEIGAIKTDTLLKQVYFPVAKNQYHLLSLLTGSGLITTFKERINTLRFSEVQKEARAAKREGENHATGYRDLFDLTITGYGGNKPQNISVLNNRNNGQAYLLPCLPPRFKTRNIRLPKQNFFTQTLYLKAEKSRFIALHKLTLSKWNNLEIRSAIENIVQSIIDLILYKAYQLRSSSENNWTDNDAYQNLPMSQKIWLDNQYKDLRAEDSEWREDVAKQMARVILSTYEDINGKTSLDDTSLKFITHEVEQSLAEDKEFF